MPAFTTDVSKTKATMHPITFGGGGRKSPIAYPGGTDNTFGEGMTLENLCIRNGNSTVDLESTSYVETLCIVSLNFKKIENWNLIPSLRD